jgi:hypothetical protein
MPFRDARKSVLQKLRASNCDPLDPTSVLHPALPLAFFSKSSSGNGFLTPREPEAMPHVGLAVVLASDSSRYEGDWHQLRCPAEELLQRAFASAYAGAPEVIRAHACHVLSMMY